MSLTRRRSRRRRRMTIAAAILATASTTMAQSCISLKGSTQCPAFNASSISTGADVSSLFPFVQYVTDTASFDNGLQTYISGYFIQQRFGELIGCSSFNASDPIEYYARYTTSVICNAIIQNSISACSLTGQATAPLCASTCALYASSEDEIATSSACGTAGANAESQIRADLTNCQLPAQSLAESCILGSTNQPDRCGFGDNSGGLCDYCGSGSPNATDSCCVFSNAETLCKDLKLPITSVSTASASGTSATSSPASSTASSRPLTSDAHGLNGGQIAGLVIGTIVGALLLLALIIIGSFMIRRRREQRQEEWRGPSMSQHDGASARAPEHGLPASRSARLSTMDGEHDGWAVPLDARYGSHGRDSPMLRHTPPLRGKSSKLNRVSLIYDSDDDEKREDMSSPEGTGLSEQLTAFKDYYSQDEIRTGDAVSTLWAYQPRAQDEFELERGDMLKVVGIWDDGWATGVKINARAEGWNAENARSNRDSGVDTDEEGDQEVKAFPLVCVCLPRYWRRTIEGDGTFDFASP